MPHSMRSSTRWTGDRNETQPCGRIEYCRHAVAGLGPFKDTASEETAREQIEALARRFNHKVQANEGAPRAKHVVEQLEKLQALAVVFAEYLTSLDDLTRLQLSTYGTGLNDSTYVAQFHPADADIEGLPPMGGGDEGRWVMRLRSLSQSVQLTTQLFKSSHVDKGGNINLYKSIVGEPRFCLVQEGLIIFETYKPGRATGTVGGPLHEFLMNVFEYATGLNKNDHAKLEQWVRKLPKAYRRMPQIKHLLLQLEAEADTIQKTQGGPSKAAHLRLGEIITEKDCLDKEHAKLWDMFYCAGP
jgi:hypothetical protein